MEPRTAHAEPRPRRPKQAASARPEDDRFAPHPGETIDTVYVIARAMDLILARPREVIGVMLASLVISSVLLVPLIAFGLFETAGLGGPLAPAGVTVLLVLAWACALLLQAPLVGSAIEVHTTRRGLFFELLRRGLTQLPNLMIVSAAALGLVVLTLAIAGALVAALVALTAFVPWEFVTLMLRFAGTVAIAIMALRVITAFGLVVPIVVVEQLAPADALRRSWALGWPNSFPILVALVLPSLMAQAALFLTSFFPPAVSVVATIGLGLGLAIYQSVIAPVAYVAIREYVDGLDPARLLARPRR